MLRFVHSIIQPPSKLDEEQDLVARWLHYILIGGFAGAFLITLSAFIFQAAGSYRISLPFMAGALIAFGLNKAGRTNASTFVFLVLMVGTITYATLRGGGIHDTIVIMYPVIVVVGGLILNPRVYWLLVTITLFSVGLVVTAETQGWLVTSFREYTDITDFVQAASILGVQALIVNLLIENLKSSLKKSRLENLERIRAENEREAVIQELQLRNDELLRFNYTVSHELKSPIVTIKGFLGMLQRDLQRNDPKQIESDFQRIAGATDKMHELLSNLLEYSRNGRFLNPPEEIDPVLLIQEALDNLDARLRSKNVAISILPSLPKIHGDRIRLREVFENMIDNAAKYMGDQPAPLIEIGAQQKDGEHAFYVKDNGMGIEPAYQVRIFALFEKLNPASEGTGIGLTLVKRIIETHGGRIWVESGGRGKGTAFWFTLPHR